MHDPARRNNSGNPLDTHGVAGCDIFLDIIWKFTRSQLGLNPGEIFADEHDNSITISMKRVLTDAERNGAKNKRTAELICRSYTEAFRAVSSLLALECSAALGKSVETAAFFLDPQSNCASIILSTVK